MRKFWSSNMSFFYFDPIFSEKTKADDSTIFYIVQIQAGYAFRGISSGFDKLRFDPMTPSATSCWLLNNAEILSPNFLTIEKSKILFPEGELTHQVMDLETLNSLGINLSELQKKDFNQNIHHYENWIEPLTITQSSNMRTRPFQIVDYDFNELPIRTNHPSPDLNNVLRAISSTFQHHETLRPAPINRILSQSQHSIFSPLPQRKVEVSETLKNLMDL